MKKTSDQVVTKSDVKRAGVSLKNFATRTDLKNMERNLRGEILRVEEKVEGLEDLMRKQHDAVMTAVSNFAGRAENLKTENQIGSDQIRRLDERVTILENQ